jgi:hypothetical protein
MEAAAAFPEARLSRERHDARAARLARDTAERIAALAALE